MAKGFGRAVAGYYLRRGPGACTRVYLPWYPYGPCARRHLRWRRAC